MSVKCFYVGSTIDFDTFLESEFLHWNRSELAPGTPLVGFSMSVKCFYVGSTIDFDTFFKSEFLQWKRLELAPGTPLVGFSRSDSEGFVYSKNIPGQKRTFSKKCQNQFLNPRRNI